MSKKEKLRPEKSYLEAITDKIGEIAMHYGFSVIKPPEICDEDIQKHKQFKDFDHHQDTLEKIALTRWYMNERMDLEAQPVTIHYKKPFPGHFDKRKTGTEIYGFEIMGSFKPTSEALLIKCVLAILEECGYKDLFIDINSIGDKESIAKFERELNNHFRKQAHTISAKIRQEFKKNHHLMLMDTRAETIDFRKNVPQPIGFLSENSRLHFKEVLEYVETFDTIYKIKPSILANRLYASNTVFEIRKPKNSPRQDKFTSIIEEDGGELLAYGYRYNHLAKKIGGKREIPSVGVTLFIKRNPKMAKKISVEKIKRPRLYLAQLGPLAKLKSLHIVERLRKHKIPVYHSITKDKITGQLSGAEYMGASHVLIMGQKEAVDNTVIVRDVISREQETVFLDELCDFLKKHLKKQTG